MSDETQTLMHRQVLYGENGRLVQQQFIWAEMAAAAQPILTSYHTDLYHDALWLARQVTGEQDVAWWYGISTTGTTIYTTLDVAMTCRVYRPTLYHCRLVHEGINRYVFTMELMAE